ncbi:MGDG synthase family glycosyltransferase [Polymorphospora rubra]|uniref:MGDG synthase family glycosyltransferase n=1 Tax=Polymorphospora rubra TaxID=338584 RepID=UPI001BB3D9A2|nr:UDP-N-acetylglucosamine--LPS N-acetylglucosamine transferase [Polymorphospora rubra]
MSDRIADASFRPASFRPASFRSPGSTPGTSRSDPWNRTSGRVLVVSADIGAGHDAAAAELGHRLSAHGLQVDHLNFFTALSRPVHWLVRETYRMLLRWSPGTYAGLFTLTERSPSMVTAIRGLLGLARARMLARLAPDTRLIVTTYPFANQLLGPLRRTGRVTVPIVAYVTDISVHPAWLSPGVDTYCVIHDAARQQAGGWGARDVRVVDPLISARFAPTTTDGKRQARLRFGLPDDGRLALIVAGSWGVGDVVRTAADVLAAGGIQPVVVCGRNEPMRRLLRGLPGHVMGWVQDMPTLMRAVDVVVENSGGQTCQQSLACGLPTITYRPIPGHGTANAEILDRHGLTTHVSTPQDLKPVLGTLTAPVSVPGPSRRTGDITAVVLEALYAHERLRRS